MFSSDAEQPFKEFQDKKRGAPVSRILSRTIIYLNCEIALAVFCSPPAASTGPVSDGCLLGIAPMRVYHAADVAVCAVGSYPAISPLPLRAVYFLLHFPSQGSFETRARELPGHAPYGVRTFLTPGFPGRAMIRCAPCLYGSGAWI